MFYMYNAIWQYRGSNYPENIKLMRVFFLLSKSSLIQYWLNSMITINETSINRLRDEPVNSTRPLLWSISRATFDIFVKIPIGLTFYCSRYSLSASFSKYCGERNTSLIWRPLQQWPVVCSVSQWNYILHWNAAQPFRNNWFTIINKWDNINQYKLK